MENINNNFHFKKSMGQNFIFDVQFLTALVDSFSLASITNVLEIGAGMGSLTRVLASKFKKVISFEIDKTLTEKLGEIKKEFSNLSFIFSDVLKVQTTAIDQLFGGENYVIIANIPYNITSPIVFKFLIESDCSEKMFLMVQREVAERFVAKPGSKTYGIPSVILSTFARCSLLKQVSRRMFFPSPKVDSCVIKIEKVPNDFSMNDKKEYATFVSGCFNMKRKTLLNNLQKMNFEKHKIEQVFEKLNIKKTQRSEQLSSDIFVRLFDLLK